MAGIDSDLIRGHIDTIILKSLYHGDKYGLEIIQEIEDKSNGSYELKQPTLYSCLKRLEGQGLISSYWEDSEIGGKRHYYTLTDMGKETYKNNQEEWMRSREIIDNLIYNNSSDNALTMSAENEETPVNNDTPIIDQVYNATDEMVESSANLVDDEENDFLADENQTDEFANFDTIESTAFNTFFEANNETASQAEFEDITEEYPAIEVTSNNVVEESVEETYESNEDEAPELVSLEIANDNTDDVLEDDAEVLEEPTYETNDEPEQDSHLSFIDMLAFNSEPEHNENQDEPELEETQDDTPEGQEENEQQDNLYEGLDDDAIYEPEPEIDEDDQIYVPETDDEDDAAINLAEPTTTEIEEQEEKVIVSPTYINFDNPSYDEVDITNQDFEEDDAQDYVNFNNEETEFTENYFLEIEPDDDVEQANDATAELEETYNTQTLQRASQEEIESLYRTTENYEKLQAGYTDETYKQMLNELESYGSSQPNSNQTTTKASVLSYTELSQTFENEGIEIRRYEKQIKESNDTKIYIKTNKIHLITNWITFGISAFALLLTFLIMNAFKDGYTYNFAFWQFAVAAGVAILLPLYHTIKYAINPYKKVVAKYAPRLNILISVLITIQLILIIYCINLQHGFYSFSQENYNHLLWILPLILSFIPIIQALVYMPLYNSKNYHT